MAKRPSLKVDDDHSDEQSSACLGTMTDATVYLDNKVQPSGVCSSVSMKMPVTGSRSYLRRAGRGENLEVAINTAKGLERTFFYTDAGSKPRGHREDARYGLHGQLMRCQSMRHHHVEVVQYHCTSI